MAIQKLLTISFTAENEWILHRIKELTGGKNTSAFVRQLIVNGMKMQPNGVSYLPPKFELPQEKEIIVLDKPE